MPAASRPRTNAGGFTYIGLLVLVAMMGAALSVVSEVWQTSQQREREQELLFVGDQYRRAIAQFAANSPAYPQRLEDLLKDPAAPEVRRYLRKLYRDPITGSADWGLVKSVGDTIIGVYSLSDREPLKQSGFSLADRSFEGKKKYSDWIFQPRIVQGIGAPPAAAIPRPGSPASPGRQKGVLTRPPGPR